MSAFMLGCGGDAPARFPTASSLPDQPRRPDGIAVDRVRAPLTAGSEAPSRQGFVALRPPLGDDVALQLVRRFFEAVVAEDTAAIAAMVSASTVIHDTTPNRNRPQQAALPVWRNRFQKYDYLRLSPTTVYRAQAIRTYRGADIEALPAEIRSLVGGGDGPGDDALVLQVEILTPVLDNERVFGDVVYFWLERRGEHFQIVKLAEDVPL